MTCCTTPFCHTLWGAATLEGTCVCRANGTTLGTVGVNSLWLGGITAHRSGRCHGAGESGVESSQAPLHRRQHRQQQLQHAHDAIQRSPTRVRHTRCAQVGGVQSTFLSRPLKVGTQNKNTLAHVRAVKGGAAAHHSNSSQRVYRSSWLRLARKEERAYSCRFRAVKSVPMHTTSSTCPPAPYLCGYK